MGFKSVLGLGIIGTAFFFLFRNTEIFAKQLQKSNVPTRLSKWSEQVSSAAQKTNIPPALIYAIIERESAGNPNASRQETNFVSRGLMQISGPTARDMGYNGDLKNLMNPETNIRYGTKYLRWLFDSFNANPYIVNRRWKETVAAYNAGINTIRNKGIINPNYVSFVLDRLNKYRE